MRQRERESGINNTMLSIIRLLYKKKISLYFFKFFDKNHNTRFSRINEIRWKIRKSRSIRQASENLITNIIINKLTYFENTSLESDEIPRFNKPLYFFFLSRSCVAHVLNHDKIFRIFSRNYPWKKESERERIVVRNTGRCATTRKVESFHHWDAIFATLARGSVAPPRNNNNNNCRGTKKKEAAAGWKEIEAIKGVQASPFYSLLPNASARSGARRPRFRRGSTSIMNGRIGSRTRGEGN